jgi:hypothetical protein
MGAEAAAATRQRLGGLLQGCTRGAPFTLQRFAELLLAPSRQYSSFVKLVGGLHRGMKKPLNPDAPGTEPQASPG